MQHLMPEAFAEQRKVVIGYYPDNQKEASVRDYFLGDAWAVFAMTGFGKSIEVGNLAVELAKYRNLIIFDYKGDYRNLKYVNFSSRQRKYGSIPDLVYLHRFGFKLQDFKNPFDWEMLGMTENGANLCASKAKQVLYHRNDFNEFYRMISETKVYGRESGETWYGTRQSVLSKLHQIRNSFVDDKNSTDITHMDINLLNWIGKKYYVSDWKYFIKKHKHLCLNFNSEFEPQRARFMAGKILNELEPIMNDIMPVIIIEEAHELCPNYVDKDLVSYSLVKIIHYLKNLHKKGTKLILITQNPSQLHESCLDEIKRFFIGKLQNIKGHGKLDDIFRLSSALEYNHILNYREFWHYSMIYNERSIFVPYDSYSFYKRRV